ncbi:MAG TPA: heme-binding protein [Streptosporangiaceae bacterium]|nr:heme-binding protein [Streptosporangiaceae bacterium]
MTDMRLVTALSSPSGFRFGEVSSLTAPRALSSSVPSLGPLAAFAGTFRGSGFNTIFRPDNKQTPTPLPVPVNGSDNVLELNLTQETLSFSPSLGSVPNRGEVQGDIFLNGIPYLQTISDVTVPSQPVGIHVEPGLWMAVPATTDPAEGPTVVRMASIPHGTTVQAQGTSHTVAGKPAIAAVDITPFVIGQPGNKVPFPSQTAANDKAARIPQNLGPFITAGTITQAMLADPNTLLRNHIAAQTVTSTTVISVSTDPAAPLFGGGTGNIAFLLGNPAASAPNAQAVKMEAVFWVETVEFAIEVPVFEPGQPSLVIPAETGAEGQPVPEFLVNPPVPVKAPRTIRVTAPQIQYSQQVLLNFNGLSWPHVSVATLVPAGPVAVPASAWA